MVVSLLKVLNSGLQDERLLSQRGNPSIDAVLKTYVRAGRFTTEWYKIDFDSQPAFGQTARITLPRRGHLITRLYLITTMPDIATPQQQAISTVASMTNGASYAGPYFGWTNSLGHALLTEASLEIGGNVVSRLDGRLLEVLDEFRTPLEKVPIMNRLLPRADNGFSATSFGFSTAAGRPTVATTPLPFWFTTGESASALPIDAISRDSVSISFKFNTLDKLYVASDMTSGGIRSLSSPTTAQSNISTTRIIYDECGIPIANQQFTFYSTVITGNTIQPSSIFTIPGMGMPAQQMLSMGPAYLMAEYVYLDSPEANRFRLGDLTIPITQFYKQMEYDTKGLAQIRIPLRVPNPTRNLFFYAHRQDAEQYNAPFLATRELTAPQSSTLWWPNARGLGSSRLTTLLPAFATADSEPLTSIQLLYEGKLVRYASHTPAFFRSLLPSIDQVKSPWHNRYFYTLPFGTQDRMFGPTEPLGAANLDKITRIELQLQFSPERGSLNTTQVPRYTVYSWAESMNILRIYGGRAGLLFGY